MTEPFRRGVEFRDQPAHLDLQFPTRYRGAFERDRGRGIDPDAGRPALGPAARDMLQRRLGPDAAGRLITIVERMAAAAATDHAGPG